MVKIVIASQKPILENELETALTEGGEVHVLKGLYENIDILRLIGRQLTSAKNSGASFDTDTRDVQGVSYICYEPIPGGRR